MHHIPLAGGIGLVFVAGYVFMIWHGAPEYRPLVVGLPILGAMAAGVLIWRNERRRPAGGHRTGVSGAAGQQEDAQDEARKEDSQ